MISEESELAPIKEHILACPSCAERTEQVQDYVNAMRAAMIAGGFDLE
jgi:hypothetical protein